MIPDIAPALPTQSKRRRRGLLAKLRIEGKVLFALSLLLSIGLFVLGFLWLVTYPWGVFEGWSSTHQPTTIAEYLVESAGLRYLVLPAALLCLGTALVQRHQADRYSPIILLAMVIGLFGGTMEVFAMNEVASYLVEFQPKGLIRLSIGALWFSAMLALVEILRISFKRSPQRGRWIAAYLVVWAGWGGAIQKVWVLDRQPLIQPMSGIQLLGSESDQLRAPRHMHKPSPGTPSLVYAARITIDAHGEISVEGQPVSAHEDDQLRTSVRSAIGNHADPERAPLLLFVDRSAPWSSVVRLVTLAATAEGGTRLFSFAAERELVPHEEWKIGLLPMVLVPADQLASEVSTPLALEVIPASDDGKAAYALGGVVTTDLPALRAALESESRRTGGAPVVLRSPADAHWNEVAELIIWLLDEVRIPVGGFEVID